MFLLIAYGGYRMVRFVYRLCFRPPMPIEPASQVAARRRPRCRGPCRGRNGRAGLRRQAAGRAGRPT